MELVYMITIVDRDQSEAYTNFFRGEGAGFMLRTLGRGTANDEILNYLGLGESEKEVFFCALIREKANAILAALSTELRMGRPGTGVAFTIPITAVCGTSSLHYLSGRITINIEEGKKEEKAVQQEQTHDLIMAIANRGYVDDIMEIAREAGVRGGTVIHAIGNRAGDDGKFFGISVAREKELILMVVEKEIRSAVMKAITEGAGHQTKAKCVLFSLPVNGVAGIK